MCQNGGTCVWHDNTGTFTCNCAAGFYGDVCASGFLRLVGKKHIQFISRDIKLAHVLKFENVLLGVAHIIRLSQNKRSSLLGEIIVRKFKIYILLGNSRSMMYFWFPRKKRKKHVHSGDTLFSSFYHTIWYGRLPPLLGVLNVLLWNVRIVAIVHFEKHFGMIFLLLCCFI